MATTTHILEGYGTNGTSTPQFQDILTVPTGKIAKVKITSLTVQNTTSAAENYNWKAGIYCVTPRPNGSTVEVLLDTYQSNNYTSYFSHYVLTPSVHRGDTSTASGHKGMSGQDTYNDYSTTILSSNLGDGGMFNPEFYLKQGEVLRFTWRHLVNGMTDFEFFLRGFYLLEDVTS